MEKTLDSIKILGLLNAQIQRNFETLSKIETKNDNAKKWIFYIVKYITIIQTVSFLDEWDKFLGIKAEDQYKADIQKLKKIVNPAILRVKKWKGMRAVRNSMLAHNLRNRKLNYRFVFLSNELANADIPNHITEYEVLAKCLDMATLIITKPFQKELTLYNDKFHENDTPFIANIINPDEEIEHIKKVIMENVESFNT